MPVTTDTDNREHELEVMADFIITTKTSARVSIQQLLDLKSKQDKVLVKKLTNAQKSWILHGKRDYIKEDHTKKITSLQESWVLQRNKDDDTAKKIIDILSGWDHEQRSVLFILGAICVGGNISNLCRFVQKYTQAWENARTQIPSDEEILPKNNDSRILILNMVNRIAKFFPLNKQETKMEIELALFQQEVEEQEATRTQNEQKKNEMKNPGKLAE